MPIVKRRFRGQPCLPPACSTVPSTLWSGSTSLVRNASGRKFGSRLLILFGLLSMGVAVPFILVQRNFRRLLAYSSIDHSGIMVLALGFGGPLGILGMLLHMTFHSVTKPLLFFCGREMSQQHLKTDLFQKAKGGLTIRCP